MDFTGGLVPPETGLYCKMFYTVSDTGTLTFRTAFHVTAGTVSMSGPGGVKPINWTSSEMVGSFEVIQGEVIDSTWIQLTGSHGIGRGDTLRYIAWFGNLSSGEAAQCSLFLNTGDLAVVSTSLSCTTFGDNNVVCGIGTLPAGEVKKVEFALTLPQTTDRQYLNSRIPVAPIIVWLVAVFGGFAVIATATLFIQEFTPHPELLMWKSAPGSFVPPFTQFGMECRNAGFGASCEDVKVEATMIDYSGCLLDVSTQSGEVSREGNRWEIIWQHIGDLRVNNFWSLGEYIPPWTDIVKLSLATDSQCDQDSIIFYAKASYFNEEYEPARLRLDNRIRRQKHVIGFARDPNEMVVYPENFITPGQTLYYTVFFENEGSAPAESIRIISKIDTNLTDQSLFIPDSSVVYNAFERKIDWDFPHINLQPDSSSFVSYVIQAKDNLESGTVINGNATIYFDYIPGVPCSVSVTVDALNPISKVDSVKWVSYPDTFEVFWSGYDPAPGSSGISSYSIYCSVDGRPDSLWFADSAWFEDDTLLKTSAIFVADSGHYYGFTSIAMDRVWNIEEAPAHPDVYFPFLRGDAYRDGKLNVSDVIYIINYLFKNGPPPTPVEAADVNCDGKVNVTDVVYFINYLFKGGPPLC
jgi:uncharacterized repeat protein (TIGR01451 family)